MSEDAVKPAAVKSDAAHASDFYTRGPANEGLVFWLQKPSGETTDKWLRILGCDSDKFRRAETQKERSLMAISQLDSEEDRTMAILVSKREMVASLVIDWNLQDDLGPCTLANVVAFFGEAPQIADAVDQIARRRSLFFGLRSLNSLSLQSGASASQSDLAPLHKQS